MKKGIIIRIVLAVLIVSFLSLASFYVSIYSELLWFQEVGYSSVFLKILFTKIIIGVAGGVIFLIFLMVNIYIARKLAPKYRVIFEVEALEKLRAGFSQFLGIAAFAVALFISFLAGLIVVDKWEVVLKYLNSVSFNFTDPIFGRDVGFYIFELPFYQNLYAYIMGLFVLTLIIVTLIHFLDGAIGFSRGREWFAPHVKTHISILLGMIFFLQAWGYNLRIFELLYSARGAAFGASYTDINAQMPALKILIVVTLFCAGLFLINIYFKGWKLPVAGILILFISSFIFGSVYPALIQQYRVSPNEIEKEKEYIKNNIEFTRIAYNLDKIKAVDFSVEDTINQEVLTENKTTLDNIRLWDWRPIKDTYSQLQEIRLYYSFLDVDVDRYYIDGEYRQVLLSARELDKKDLTSKAQTWVNNRLVYTHGYGLCLSPVNEVTEEGLPNLFIKDIPPVFTTDLKLDKPELYFGEGYDDYVFVKTKTKEFDYPKGDINEYTVYEGNGGIPLSSFLRKVIFSWKFGDLKMLMSDAITKESRIIIRRQITERIRTIVPFLSLDHDPYLIVSKGKLYWMADAYVVSDMFPYSHPYQDAARRSYDFNYIRNSVKIVVDAYNGDVDFYMTPEEDPLILAYKKIFPNRFKDFSEMPEDLKSHIRYPEDLFMIQSNVFTEYHMTDPQVFYNREDLWEIPNEIFGGGSEGSENRKQMMEPYYIIIKLPDSEKERFVLMIPFTPTNKNNMVAWFSANCDFPGYGELLVYKFPKQKLVYGPMQVEARIDQDSEISKLLTLWGQKGSSVIRGNLLVIPIGKSIMYVEPLYLQAEESKFPELKKVILSYGSKIAIDDNLEGALEILFGEKKEEAKDIPEEEKEKEPSGDGIDELIKAASEHY
ncbi:MAG: UPF0182 family protein, partial [Actinomycetia bacterium]|nr:UPF0182 family protein [Actinomycetes bacterium]